MDVAWGTLRCTLLDRRSSVPLSGARAMCVGRDGRASVFDADPRGAFEKALPQGVYDLVISAHGYLSLTVRGVGVLAGYCQALTRALVPGEEGQTADDQPATAIAGYVVDRVGLAVPGVAIHVNGTDRGSAYTTRTDRQGAYVVNGVPPGMYDLAARSDERTLAREHVPIAHVKTLVRVDLRLVQL